MPHVEGTHEAACLEIVGDEAASTEGDALPSEGRVDGVARVGEAKASAGVEVKVEMLGPMLPPKALGVATLRLVVEEGVVREIALVFDGMLFEEGGAAHGEDILLDEDLLIIAVKIAIPVTNG